MGFGDKLKGLREQAQQTVSENRDKIQDAVQAAGQVANARTGGKYADKIAKVGDTVTSGVDKFGAADDGSAHATSTTAADAETTAPVSEPAPAPTVQPTGAPPEFE